jgi:diguanylate cyclase (GGDEF)-like protein
MGEPNTHKNYLERSNRMLAELLLINSVIRTSSDLQDVLDTIVEAACRALGFEIAVINLRDLKTDMIELRAHSGLDPDGVRLLEGASYGGVRFYELLQGRERVGSSYFIPHDSIDWDTAIEGPVYFPELQESNLPNSERWHPEDALLALIQVYDEDQITIMGDIWVDAPFDGRRPDELTMQMLSHFADQVAITLRNMNLINSLQITTDRLHSLHKVSRDLVSAGPEPDAIYKMIHEAVTRLMPCEAFVVSTVDEKGEITAVYLIDRAGREEPRHVPRGSGLSSIVISSGETIYIKDVLQMGDHSDNFLHFGSPDSIRSILAVPMLFANRVTGMLSAQSYETDAFSSEDQRLLEMLASYAAIALENARLLMSIQRLAVTDPLTGLHNRRQLFEIGTREFQRALRFERELAAVMVDIDHFKILNDSFGHLAGDRILVGLARILQSSTRDVDLVARYGGEEFVVLMPETGLSPAREAAERLRIFVARYPIALENLPEGTGPLRDKRPNQVLITVSIGVAVLDARTPDLETLLARADTAMYVAKAQGRNRVEVWR